LRGVPPKAPFRILTSVEHLRGATCSCLHLSHTRIAGPMSLGHGAFFTHCKEVAVIIGCLRLINGRMEGWALPFGAVRPVRDALRKWRIHRGAQESPVLKGAADLQPITRPAGKMFGGCRLFSLSRALSRINGSDSDSGQRDVAACSVKEARRVR
jgi:hypothetical protein